MVKIHSCTCLDEFQDKAYGKGMRAMNNAPLKGNAKNRYRCTVCSREHTIGAMAAAAKTKVKR